MSAQRIRHEGMLVRKFYLDVLHVDARGKDNGEVSHAELHVEAPLLKLDWNDTTGFDWNWDNGCDRELPYLIIPIVHYGWKWEEELSSEKELVLEERSNSEQNYAEQESGIIVIEVEGRKGYYIRVGYYDRSVDATKKVSGAIHVDQSLQKQRLILI